MTDLPLSWYCPYCPVLVCVAFATVTVSIESLLPYQKEETDSNIKKPLGKGMLTLLLRS
jgi:hypothetical protein